MPLAALKGRTSRAAPPQLPSPNIKGGGTLRETPGVDLAIIFWLPSPSRLAFFLWVSEKLCGRKSIGFMGLALWGWLYRVYILAYSAKKITPKHPNTLTH